MIGENIIDIDAEDVGEEVRGDAAGLHPFDECLHEGQGVPR